MRKAVLVLTSEQIAELDALARATDNAQVRTRCLAVLRLHEESGYRAVARALAVNESAVRKWYAAYRQAGLPGLQPRDRPGRPPKLTRGDRAVLEEALAGTPSDFGLTGQVWTASLLNRHLQSRSPTRVTDWTVWAYIQSRRRDEGAKLAAADQPTPGRDETTDVVNEVSPDDRDMSGSRKEDETMPNSVSVWDPMRDLLALRQAMDRLTDDRWSQRPGGSGGALFLPLDVYTTEDEVVVLASMPGVTAEDVDIMMQGDTVTIRGEAKPPEGNVQWAVQERPYGKFSRAVTLNVPVDMANAEATFENGVLTLRLPKAEAAKPRQIQIKTKEAGSGE